MKYQQAGYRDSEAHSSRGEVYLHIWPFIQGLYPTKAVPSYPRRQDNVNPSNKLYAFPCQGFLTRETHSYLQCYTYPARDQPTNHDRLTGCRAHHRVAWSHRGILKARTIFKALSPPLCEAYSRFFAYGISSGAKRLKWFACVGNFTSVRCSKRTRSNDLIPCPCIGPIPPCWVHRIAISQ